jgi:hypothetical protein
MPEFAFSGSVSGNRQQLPQFQPEAGIKVNL